MIRWPFVSRKKLDAAESRYISAVKTRQELRDGLRQVRAELADRDVAVEVGKVVVQNKQLRAEAFRELARAHTIGENAKATEVKYAQVKMHFRQCKQVVSEFLYVVDRFNLSTHDRAKLDEWIDGHLYNHGVAPMTPGTSVFMKEGQAEPDVLGQELKTIRELQLENELLRRRLADLEGQTDATAVDKT